jgi:hypothetical protein
MRHRGLDHNDRIVDNHANSEDQPEQREHVQRETEYPHDREGPD